MRLWRELYDVRSRKRETCPSMSPQHCTECQETGFEPSSKTVPLNIVDITFNITITYALFVYLAYNLVHFFVFWIYLNFLIHDASKAYYCYLSIGHCDMFEFKHSSSLFFPCILNCTFFTRKIGREWPKLVFSSAGATAIQKVDNQKSNLHDYYNACHNTVCCSCVERCSAALTPSTHRPPNVYVFPQNGRICLPPHTPDHRTNERICRQLLVRFLCHPGGETWKLLNG